MTVAVIMVMLVMLLIFVDDMIMMMMMLMLLLMMVVVMVLRTKVTTQRSLYTEQQIIYTQNFYTEELLQTDTFTWCSFYAQNTFTHGCVYMQGL